MKVKVTATVTLETELFPEDYGEAVGSDDAVIAFELQQMRDEPWESSLGNELLTSGELSGVKIEKIEASPAQEKAA
jgi:hypothetical protein